MSFRDVALLRKFAEASLRPHQERVVEKVSLQPTLAVHSLGSGKTLTALQSILEAKRDNPGKKALDEKVLIDKELRKVMQRATGPGLEKKSAIGGGIGEWFAIKAAIGAGAHVAQSLGANAALRTKAVSKRAANNAAAGLFGKDIYPSDTLGRMKEGFINTVSPDTYLLETKARHAGESLRNKLKESGVDPDQTPK